MYSHAPTQSAQALASSQEAFQAKQAEMAGQKDTEREEAVAAAVTAEQAAAAAAQTQALTALEERLHEVLLYARAQSRPTRFPPYI
jgi:hypothetical protein